MAIDVLYCETFENVQQATKMVLMALASNAIDVSLVPRDLRQ
jgi:S-adenosylmethionine/arginine decarboxylase-like enzyme